MAIGQKLVLKQSQTINMTQQLRQSLEILQLSSLDLNNYITEELEKNPLLQGGEASEESETQNSEDSLEPGRVKGQENNDIKNDTSDVFNAGGEVENLRSNEDYENLWQQKDSGAGGGDTQGNTYDAYEPRGSDYYPVINSGFNSNDDFSYEKTLSKEKDLREHLVDQINIEIHEQADKIIGLHLLDMLDDSGYVSSEFDKLAETLGCNIEKIERVLAKLQQFEPAGIFSRNLEECLAIQLKDKDRLDPAMQKLLKNLDLLATHEHSKLLRICEVDSDDLRDMIAEIKQLNPKPASSYNFETIQVVQPDIFLRRNLGNPDGGWILELNNEVLPKVLVNKQYHAEISGKTKNKQDKKYISEQLSNANWLVRAVNQRAETMLKVGTEIVKQQNDFFEKGILHLKPLTLKDIAEKVELHESTISRVVNNKYIATSKGLYELKYFFTSAVGSSSNTGENYSSSSVKHVIKQIIDREDPKKPHSDDKIVKMLQSRGVDIARRTVAKYRESLKIPSSNERRRRGRSAV